MEMLVVISYEGMKESGTSWNSKKLTFKEQWGGKVMPQTQELRYQAHEFELNVLVIKILTCIENVRVTGNSLSVLQVLFNLILTSII